MFKKLLTVGALATALIGGIGTASALPECPSQVIEDTGKVYVRYIINPYNSFARQFTSNGITWYFQGHSFPCSNNGNIAYAGKYKGGY